jgi:alkylhydroperoxidase family enzyme
MAGKVEPELRSLVQAYVGLLSGCEPCARESLADARELDRDPARLPRLATWRREPLSRYTERERAALIWAEAMVLGPTGAGAPRYAVEDQLDHEDLADLTEAVHAARGWRRLDAAGAAEPGSSGQRCRRRRWCRVCRAA